MSPADVARVLRAAAAEAELIDGEHRAERRTWTDQMASPLGRRRHVAAVRRLVAAGDASAAMVGRRALLSPDALDAELAALSKRQPKREREGTAARIERRLGLVAGGGR